MKIPESFKKAQKRAFQDKRIEHYRRAEATQDGEGNDIEGALTLINTYDVNLVFISDRVIAEEWGLRLDKDVSVTYSDNYPIEHKDLIKYNNVLYEVIGKPVKDSHTALYCKSIVP